MAFFNFKKRTLIIFAIIAALAILFSLAYVFSPHMMCSRIAGSPPCQQPPSTQIFEFISRIFFFPNNFTNFAMSIDYPWYIPLEIIVAIVYWYVLACIISWLTTLNKGKK